MNAEQKAFSNAYLYSMAGVTMPDFVEFFEQLPISPEKREVDMAPYKWDVIEDAWVVWCAAVKFTKEQAT